ncbi:hypothetical protein BDU57DRAFT_39218 [Ampelomyces quisqualis]|uniref:Uncharacterized protein n=1 Tax=Ampelomyces quisqualis TaxID=50730 RepID=A0A6A5R1Z3_AMPQU|nr:hypothetical protein BDU57DRAFT_39218 [Ampelomyces quisqualis]
MIPSTKPLYEQKYILIAQHHILKLSSNCDLVKSEFFSYLAGSRPSFLIQLADLLSLSSWQTFPIDNMQPSPLPWS